MLHLEYCMTFLVLANGSFPWLLFFMWLLMVSLVGLFGYAAFVCYFGFEIKTHLLTKVEHGMHTKTWGQMVWEIQSCTHRGCITVAFWQDDFRVEYPLGWSPGFIMCVFLLKIHFLWYMKNRHHNLLILLVSLYSLFSLN